MATLNTLDIAVPKGKLIYRNCHCGENDMLVVLGWS